jgi:transcriptional regulator with XRE-family HTH domain
MIIAKITPHRLTREEKMMNFSKNLRELRARRDLTQEDLADKIGVSRQMVARYESGENYPEMDKAILIAQVLDCKLDDLINSREPVRNFGSHLAQTISVKLEKPRLSTRDKIVYITLWCFASMMIFAAVIASSYLLLDENIGNAMAALLGSLMVASWFLIMIIYKAK